MTGWHIFWIVVIVVIAVLAALYFYGRKLQKKQEASQAQIEAAKQTVTMLIIDKKRLPLKDSGLPQLVIDQTPKLLRGRKFPVVKAKVGPKIMTLACDDRIFDMVPVKKEVKAVISGIYITDVKGLRGALEAPKVKEGFIKRLRRKAQDVTEQAAKENNQKKSKKK